MNYLIMDQMKEYEISELTRYFSTSWINFQKKYTTAPADELIVQYTFYLIRRCENAIIHRVKISEKRIKKQQINGSILTIIRSSNFRCYKWEIEERGRNETEEHFVRVSCKLGLRGFEDDEMVNQQE